MSFVEVLRRIAAKLEQSSIPYIKRVRELELNSQWETARKLTGLE